MFDSRMKLKILDQAENFPVYFFNSVFEKTLHKIFLKQHTNLQYCPFVILTSSESVSCDDLLVIYVDSKEVPMLPSLISCFLRA